MGFFSSSLLSKTTERGTAVLAVLNVTPDSFFEGSRCEPDAAQRRITELARQGMLAVDIGGESTRPGAPSVPAEEQIARLAEVVRHAVVETNLLVCVDTTNAEVAEHMLSLGAHAINDVSMAGDPRMAQVVAQHGADLILMHSRGTMADMAGFSDYPEPAYADVVREVKEEWCAARSRVLAAGVRPESVLFDPGLGFHKSAHHSLTLLTRLAEFAELEVPMVVGPGRKSFLCLVEDVPPAERLGATIAACLVAAEQGATAVRVHDAFEVRQALSAARLFHEELITVASEGVACSTAC